MATALDVATQVENPVDDPYLLKAVDYYRMLDDEIIPSDRRVYLWGGRLYEKMAKKQPHAIADSKLSRVLFREVPPDRWYISTENPVEVADDKVPLPDLTVVRGDPDHYPKRPPKAADVELIVEVMDTSVAKDLGTNLRAYAEAKVPQYWVINLRAHRVEVYTRPTGKDKEGRPSYRNCAQVEPGQAVVLKLKGCAPIVIPAADILPAETPGS